MSGVLANLVTQSFTTVPVTNTQLAMYALSIRQPGIGRAEFQTFTFPLSPENLRKEPSMMTTIFDVQGTPQTNGVQRMADQYGLAPPTFSIQGTTGWQRHSNDGYLFTGLQAIQTLEQMLVTYAQLNSALIAQQATDLYTMEFYDYFKQDFWQVEPVGPQGVQQNAARTLLSYYSFRLVGIQEVSMPLLDQLEKRLFNKAANVLMRGVQTFLNPVLAAY